MVWIKDCYVYMHVTLMYVHISQLLQVRLLVLADW